MKGNPISWIDPWGLTTAIVMGGPTDKNPFGHVAVGFTGKGIFSFGTDTLPGSKFTDYLQKQSGYRDSIVAIFDTTHVQETAMIAALQKYRNKPLPDAHADFWAAMNDNCAARTNDALEAGGINSPSRPWDNFPSDIEKVALKKARGFVRIPKGSAIAPDFAIFDPM